MPIPELAESEPIPVREVWPSEAAFTAWLAENMDLLSQEVSIELELLQEETWLTGWPGWTGRMDILAKAVERDDYVVIENQMEESDNDHFAGLLNYASHSDARILILVAGEITDWHRRTIDWLNDVGGIQIYGVEMSAWRSGDWVERRLDLVAGPNKRNKWPGYEYPADKQKYLDFFRPLVAELCQQGISERNVARPVNDQEFPGGFDGITYHVGFWGGPSASTYLWIATADSDYNKQVFDSLHGYKSEIEKAFGERLVWDRRNHMRMSAVIATRMGSIDDPPEMLGEIRDWMLENLVKLKYVINPKLELAIAQLRPASEDSAQ